jgi:hypothetical protein
MATGVVSDIKHHLMADERPSGIPRRGHLGTAFGELLLAVVALAVLFLLGFAFYMSAR